MDLYVLEILILAFSQHFTFYTMVFTYILFLMSEHLIVLTRVFVRAYSFLSHIYNFERPQPLLFFIFFFPSWLYLASWVPSVSGVVIVKLYAFFFFVLKPLEDELFGRIDGFNILGFVGMFDCLLQLLVSCWVKCGYIWESWLLVCQYFYFRCCLLFSIQKWSLDSGMPSQVEGNGM